MKTLVRLIVPALLVLGARTAAAQASGIQGRVIAAETSRPLAGAAVVARLGSDTAAVGRGVAGADGRYRITGLAPGRYVVRATHTGRQATQSEPVVVAAGGMQDAGNLRPGLEPAGHL